jgi:hypothetical protein
MFQVVERGDYLRDGAFFHLAVRELHIKTEGGLFRFNRFVKLAFPLAQIVLKNLVTVLADDFGLLVACQGFGCAIEGGDFAFGIDREHADVQVPKEPPKLLIENELVLTCVILRHGFVQNAFGDLF